MTRARAAPLLERDDELAAIAAACEDARDAHGALVVVEAAAGMGKTRLLQAAAAAASERGMTTLSGRGEELEVERSFGVARQLFEGLVVGAGTGEREQLLAGAAAAVGPLLLAAEDRAAPVAEAVIDHALYWLVANIAARGPLALVIDDAHWIDRPTLRWLLYLAARLEGLTVAVVVGTRPPEPGERAELLHRLLQHRLAEPLHPRALTHAAVGELLGRGGAEPPAAAFTRACHAAAAGNPFLVGELVAAVSASGMSPTEANAARVKAIGPQTVARSVLLRLAAEPASAGALARSLAIFGGRAPLALAASAAGLDEPAAGRAADRLAAIDLIAPGRPLEFAHPIVRAAVYDALPASERAAGHLAAARLLHDGGAAAERVAAHLLHADAAGDAWVVERLCAAAAAATASGALGTTVAYLERALAEPAPAPQRPALLVALSEGYRHRHEWERAAAALREAIALAPEPALRVAAARHLCTLLLVARRHDEAADALGALRGDLAGTEPDLARELDESISTIMWLDTERAPALAERARRWRAADRPTGARERIVCSRQAWAAATAGAPAGEVAALARRALSGGDLIAEDARAHGFEMCVVALALTGAYDEAQAQLAHAIDDARRRGHGGRWGLLSAVAAHVCLLQGRLADAEEHALHALDTLRSDGIALPAARDALVDVLLERGNPGAAGQLAEQLRDASPRADPMLLAGLRLAPARLALLSGDARGGVERLEAIGHRQLALGRPNPAWCAWRSSAALVHLQLGDAHRAAALADEELALARAFGAGRTLGVALRAAALCRGDADTAALLREAVAVLEGSGAELEHARALVELGALLRRRGERGQPARDPLRRGREIAERLGAATLAERAHQELLAAGARPRRTALSGTDALTPAERRVCDLAVGNMSNRDIAQALFVTVKTVEGHLAASYRKLDVSRKHELPAALGRSG